MEGERRISKINILLISTLVICVVASIGLILISKSEKQTELTGKSGDNIKNNYTTTEQIVNTWDVSKKGDGSVTATLTDDGTLTISGTGEMKDYSSFNTSPWDSVKSQIKSVIVKNGVTSIGAYAFYGCTSLPSVNIPSGVTRVGNDAFSRCTSLTSIDVDENNTKYMDDNGVLYTKNKTEIIKYPPKKEGTEYKILNGVTSIESSAFSGCTSLTSIEIPKGVKSIGYHAIERCTSLTSIKIPEGVTSIGGYAFQECESLTSIEILDGLMSIGDNAFYRCTSLISINIPSSVTKIDLYAFHECKSLTSIGIPDGVTSIGYNAFQGCESLASIDVEEDNTKYMDDNGVLYTKDKIEIIKYPPKKEGTKYKILNGVTSIVGYAFYGCESLKSIEISDGVTSIGASAFDGCTSLTSLEIPDGVTSIGYKPFFRCEVTKTIENDNIGLPTILLRAQDQDDILYSSEGFETSNCTIEGEIVKIDEGVDYAKIRVKNGSLIGLTYILSYNKWDISKDRDGSVIATLADDWILTISGTGKMKDWSYSEKTRWYEIKDRVKTVIINNGVTSIGSNAFSDCTSLTSIEIPDSVTSIGNNAFSDCTSLTNIEIPSGVTRIEYGVFERCESLVSIEIPDSVTSIGSYAFYVCENLTSIEIPNGVTSIEYNAFSGCKSLTNIVIPSSVISIGNGVFKYCDNLIIICKSGTTAETYAKENDIDYQTDDISPTIEMTGTWPTTPVKSIQIGINVKDDLSGVNEENLKYIWSTKSNDVTKDEIINTFKNGDKIELKEVTETYYLWIYAVDKLENETISKIGEVNIDNINPKLTLNVQAGIDKIIIKAETADEESGIDDTSYKYYIKEENGTYSQGNSSGTNYTFENLKSNTKYTIKVEVSDKAGNTVSKETEVTTSSKSNKITSTIQKIDEENLIIRAIQPKTRVQEIKQNLQSEMEYEILNLEGKTVTDTTIIGTGFKVKIEDGKEYILIVWGDYTGDGQISIAELARASRVAVEEEEPELKEKMIIDVSMDGKIKVTDLAAISRLAIE